MTDHESESGGPTKLMRRAFSDMEQREDVARWVVKIGCMSGALAALVIAVLTWWTW